MIAQSEFGTWSQERWSIRSYIIVKQSFILASTSNFAMVSNINNRLPFSFNTDFSDNKLGMMVTCSKDRSIAVWDMVSPTEINLRRVLVGHR